jgi:hypothetical protein|eukprot:COSAG06_NODE_5343_length_3537_cov_20.284177_2_plen_342_part_00
MKLSTRGARERRRTDTARARRHHTEDGRGHQAGTHPSRGRTGGYSARFEHSHSQSGPLQRTQNDSVPAIDAGGNVRTPKPGQLTWVANPEKVEGNTKLNLMNRTPLRASGKDPMMHTIHTTGPLGTLRDAGVHDWSMSGRAELFDLTEGEDSERTLMSRSQSAFPAEMRYSARERAMQTNSQVVGSWSNCVATKEQRAARRYKVRTLPNCMMREVQREREGPPVSLKETGPVVLDSARSELLTDRTTGHCDKVGDPYRRGHVQRTVAGMPSGSGPLNKLRRQATGDNGWILDGTPADMSKTGRIIPPEETFERWSIGHHPSGGTLQRGDAGWAMASTSSLF